MGETGGGVGFLGRMRSLEWNLLGLRSLLDIEEDMSSSQVGTRVWRSGDNYGLGHEHSVDI